MSRKRTDTSDIHPVVPFKRIQSSCSPSFDWKNCCFICEKKENIKKGKKLSSISEQHVRVRQKVLNAARMRKDEILEFRLNRHNNLLEIGARYHMICYQKYIADRNLKVIQRSNNNVAANSIHTEVAQITLDYFTPGLRRGELFLLPRIAEYYNKKLRERRQNGNGFKNVQTNYVKTNIAKIAGDEFVFYSQPGKPDVFCSSEISVANLLLKIAQETNMVDDSEDEDNPDENGENEASDGNEVFTEMIMNTDSSINNNKILHEAAGILRQCIEEIPIDEHFWRSSDVSLDSSERFVPESLKKFMTWLLDGRAFERASTDYSSEKLRQRIITLSECIIFCSNTRRRHVIPPFHHGLMVQLQHEFGSRKLIDLLHSYGFCGSYSELRAFLTAVAKMELERNDNVYVPSNVVARNNRGSLIQEGDDNVDINTETIDGKNTYHRMARVIFQDQEVDFENLIPRIPRQSVRVLEAEYNNSLFQLLPFEIPKKKPEPRRIMHAKSLIEQRIQHYHDINIKDLAWVILRNIPRGMFNLEHKSHQAIPFWKIFHSRFSKHINTVTVACTLPSLNGKPADMTTVFTTLQKGKELAETCGQEYHIHTFDQQLYAIAQQVKFANPSIFPTLTLRLGAFHTLCSFISCIGKIWGDCGIRDMLVESGVYAGNTVDQMLLGKQFHRSVRGLSLCFEVLYTLLLDNFLIWLENYEQYGEILELIGEMCQVQAQFSGTVDDEGLNEKMNIFELEINNRIIPVLRRFQDERSSESPTFRFWISCLGALQMMLQFIRADREGNWDLHVNTLTAMLPYFFVCNRQNYSRYAPLYALEMICSLPQEVKQEFEAGRFAVNFTPGKFKSLPTDMAVEMSAIKDEKGSSGIIGLTTRDNALLRWSLTRNIQGMYGKKMGERSGISSDLNNNAEGKDRPAALQRDENHFNAILGYAKSHMTDPFSDAVRSDQLTNISTGVVATAAVTNSLLHAEEIGRKKLLEFVSGTLDSSGTNSFYDAIPKSGLLTFSASEASTSPKGTMSSRKLSISPELIYQRALVVTSRRDDVELRTIMTYPLTAIPSALFNADGSRRITQKSVFLHCLEKEVDEHVIQERTQFNNPIIFLDAMAQLQAMNTEGLTTFDDLACRLMEGLLIRLSYAAEIHLIFDRYDISIAHPKGEERHRRYGTGGRTYDIKGGRTVPNLKKLLSNDENKSNLTRFICEYIQKNLPKTEIMRCNPSKRVYLAGGLLPRENCYIISEKSSFTDPDYRCNHVEADTRIPFHIKQTSDRQSQSEEKDLIVESPDTDIFVLLVAHYNQMISQPKLWFHTGRISRMIDNRRYIPIHSLANIYGPLLCQALPSAYALTGCDTVSSLFNIGKNKTLQALKAIDDEEKSILARIHTMPIEEATKAVSPYISSLYDLSRKSKADRESINSLRYYLTVEKNLPANKLPPSEAEMIQHVKRACWQINEWMQALQPEIISRNPIHSGWTMGNCGLLPVYFDGITAVEYLDKYFCSCTVRSSCPNESCSCVALNLECCDLCKCSSKCSNMNQSEPIQNAEESEDIIFDVAIQ